MVNLITAGNNGTFEGGAITGWSGTGATLAAESTVVHGGTGSLKTTWTSASGTVNCPLTLVVGNAYTFSLWVYVPTGSAGVQIRVTGDYTGQVINTKDTWVQIRYGFVAGATSRNLTIAVSSGVSGNVCYIDDVTVDQTTNLVFDGNLGTFDDGVLSGFTAGAGTLIIEPTIVHGGNASAKVTLTTGTNGVTFAVANLTVGTNYLLTAWLYVPAAAFSGVQFAVASRTGYEVIGNVVTLSDTWVQSSAHFVADAINKVFHALYTVSGSNIGKTVYIDDVTVVVDVAAGTNAVIESVSIEALSLQTSSLVAETIYADALAGAISDSVTEAAWVDVLTAYVGTTAQLEALSVEVLSQSPPLQHSNVWDSSGIEHEVYMWSGTDLVSVPLSP